MSQQKVDGFSFIEHGQKILSDQGFITKYGVAKSGTTLDDTETILGRLTGLSNKEKAAVLAYLYTTHMRLNLKTLINKLELNFSEKDEKSTLQTFLNLHYKLPSEAKIFTDQQARDLERRIENAPVIVESLPIKTSEEAKEPSPDKPPVKLAIKEKSIEDEESPTRHFTPAKEFVNGVVKPAINDKNLSAKDIIKKIINSDYYKQTNFLVANNILQQEISALPDGKRKSQLQAEFNKQVLEVGILQRFQDRLNILFAQPDKDVSAKTTVKESASTTSLPIGSTSKAEDRSPPELTVQLMSKDVKITTSDLVKAKYEDLVNQLGDTNDISTKISIIKQIEQLGIIALALMKEAADPLNKAYDPREASFLTGWLNRMQFFIRLELNTLNKNKGITTTPKVSPNMEATMQNESNSTPTLTKKAKVTENDYEQTLKETQTHLSTMARR